MSYNLTDEVNRWRGDDTPLTTRVNLVPIKRVFKIKSHFASEKASSLPPKSVAVMKKPPINPYVDTINRDYQKNIAKLMIGGYLNTEKMNSVYNNNMEKAQTKSVWKHRPASSNNYNNANIPFTDPTKKSNANKIFNLDSPTTMKNIGGMMDEKEAELLLQNEKLLSNVQEMKDKYDEISAKARLKSASAKKKDSKVKKRIQDRLIRKEDAPTKEELEQQEEEANALKKPDFLSNTEQLDYSHITKSSTDIHDIMEKYDYIKYLQNKHEDKIFIPSPNSTTDQIESNAKDNQSSSEDPSNPKNKLSFINQPTPSLPHKAFLTAIPSDQSIHTSNSLHFDETINANTTSTTTPSKPTQPITDTTSSSTKIKNKRENGDIEKEIKSDTTPVSIYKPTLPEFKSKLYNQGDISLQEKILSLENSKKYGVNEKSQKFKNFYRNDKTEKFENYINKELSVLNLKKDDENIDMRRLEIYSNCLDMICEEFPMYGSLLAEIKNEYDKIINNIKVDQNENHLLRLKVQKLLAQNENRLLLKYETEKNKELESQLDDLLAENKRDDFEKFLLNEEDEDLCGLSKEDAKNAEIIEQYEKKISNLKSEILGKSNEIKELKEKQETMVPKKEKEELEHILKSSEDILNNLRKENEEYETTLREQTLKVKNLEKQLKDKENRYMFLIKEYNKIYNREFSTGDDKMRINRVVSIESTHTQTEEEVVSVREHVDKCIQTIYNVDDDQTQTCTRSCQVDLNDTQKMKESPSYEHKEGGDIFGEGDDNRDIGTTGVMFMKSDGEQTIDEVEEENLMKVIHYKCPKCHKCLVCGEIKKLKEAYLLQQQEKEKERKIVDKETNSSSDTKTSNGSNEDNTTNTTTNNNSDIITSTMSSSHGHIACECAQNQNHGHHYYSTSQLDNGQGPVAVLRKDNNQFHSDHQVASKILQLGKNVNSNEGIQGSGGVGDHSEDRSLKYYEVGENGIGSFSCDSILVVSPATARAISAEGNKIHMKKGSLKNKGTPLKDEIRGNTFETKISFNIPSQSSKLKNSIGQEEYGEENEGEMEGEIDKEEGKEKSSSYEEESDPNASNDDGDYTSEIDLKDENEINSSNPNTASSRTTTSGTCTTHSSSNHSRHQSHSSNRSSKKKKARVKKAKSIMISTKSSRKTSPPSDQEYFKAHHLSNMKEFRSTPLLTNNKKKTKKSSPLKQQNNGLSLRDLRSTHDKANDQQVKASRKNT